MMRRSVLTIVVFLCLSLATGFVFADPQPGTTETAAPAASAQPAQPTAPAVPTVGKVKNLRVISKDYNYIKLGWSRKNGATGYRIYRSVGNQTSFKRVKTISDLNTVSWKNSNLQPNTVYYYKVKAVNGTSASAVLKVKTYKATFDRLKTKASVSAYRDGTNVSWKSLDGVDGYQIYRAYPGGKYKKIKQVSAGITTYFDNKANSGSTCYYKVRGYKGFLFKDYTAYSPKKSIVTVKRVYIACGHGTDIVGHWDTGCTYKNMSEAGLMLPITKSFVNYMRKSGVYVYSDVDTGNNMNMIACVRAANKHPLSAYVSVHCDWYKSPTGTLPLYHSASGKRMADSLNDGVRSQVSIATRGLSKRSDLYELNMTDMPACIFETGSIKADYRVFQQKYTLYGKGLAKGLCDYLGVAFVE